MQELIKQIAVHYGYDHQAKQCAQECAELIVALTKGDMENVAEEIADVEVMIAQIKYLMAISTEHIKARKIERQLYRMERERGRRK